MYDRGEKVRIVIIPSADLSYNSGSIIYAKRLFEFFLDCGHNVYMIGSCIPQDIKYKYKKFIKVGKNLLFHPIIDDRYISDLQYTKMYISLIDLLTEIYDEWNGIDIINAHYASINSFAAAHFYKLMKVPYVLSSFGRDINIGMNCDERIYGFIHDSIPLAAQIVVSDISLKKQILTKFPSIQSDKIVAVPMPLDDNIFSCSGNRLIEKDNSTYIFSTINSCFTPEKGIEDILRAIALVKEKYCCKLYIAGQDDDDELINYKNLVAEVESLGLMNEVVFLGYLSREKIGQLYDASDIFIDARWYGNFSSVLLEAQFKHCVTIASNNTAAKKIITNKVNGILFPVNDVSELAKEIEEVLNNKGFRQQLIEGMKTWCATKGMEYKQEVCMKKLEKIFRTVTGA